jgi:DNA-binding cell septation regulator SpoVG
MEIIFLDIDFTILRPNSKLVVIDKEEPNRVLFRIEPSQSVLLTSYWKKYNLRVDYNGMTYWLSPEMYDGIKRIKKNLPLNRVGISAREWTSKEILDTQKTNIDFVLKNLKHLKDKNAQVVLLTARESKDNHAEFLKTIKEELKNKLKVSILKEYFVNDMEANVSSSVTATRKAKIILEHLVGYKIMRNRFVETTQSEYETAYFYDDDSINIDVANELQDIFEVALKETKPELKAKIIQRMKSVKLKLETNLATNNSLNPFITNEVILTVPYNLDLYESFKLKNDNN